ncbi:uncharacterized protein L201_006721 [Kwoniella dendrophila CBS 6074]|uniref:Uncharacterized protein n=1 Tax=Kwoniella dendrophila CBS 6074 TaxID=1295534 RepID=A0AAX4K3M9_9TREE
MSFDLEPIATSTSEEELDRNDRRDSYRYIKKLSEIWCKKFRRDYIPLKVLYVSFPYELHEDEEYDGDDFIRMIQMVSELFPELEDLRCERSEYEKRERTNKKMQLKDVQYKQTGMQISCKWIRSENQWKFEMLDFEESWFALRLSLDETLEKTKPPSSLKFIDWDITVDLIAEGGEATPLAGEPGYDYEDRLLEYRQERLKNVNGYQIGLKKARKKSYYQKIDRGYAKFGGWCTLGDRSTGYRLSLE